ncbi:transporter substrate-binding domain-containing protein [Salinisphaera sp. Q1T1-3]|uniref:transporter substrate-binding domain-containing protein n=1 Tax=Salinisphaera sp. Q1T1-3 TaxID=2321229 RepID=UPI000E751167|nr:transporter substrate-binding domain-containing protein [Salinisphaera sp. Q1T1-3]RJS91828.1 ABC transporter substrate-binding protein [Salinisphaera sp. Q1T1-3]
MNKLFTAVFVASTLFATTGVAMAAKTVRIATNVPYKPMEYTTPDGTLTGFDIDLGNAICKQAGLNCKWSQQSWNGLIPGLMARKYDAIMSSMTINEERQKVLLFSDPYIVVPSGFFVPAGSKLTNPNAESLKGKRIGVQRGTVQDQYVTDKYGDEATIKRYANADDVAVDMSAGRLDIAFLDFPTGQSTLLDQGGYKNVGPALTKPQSYFGTGFGIAFRKNEKDLAAKFNQALKTLKQNGTYEKIHAKYFGDNGDEARKSAG